jgi:hypothetical protein
MSAKRKIDRKRIVIDSFSITRCGFRYIGWYKPKMVAKKRTYPVYLEESTGLYFAVIDFRSGKTVLSEYLGPVSILD